MENNLSQVEVFWIATPFNVAIGYQRFKERCCLHYQSTETLVSFRNTSWRHNTEDIDLNFHSRENLKSLNLNWISEALNVTLLFLYISWNTYVYIPVTKHDTKMVRTSRRRHWVHLIVNSNYTISGQQEPTSKILITEFKKQLPTTQRTIIVNV
jgi:hypothetical protein